MKYYELAIEGPACEVKGFCRGVRAACDENAPLIFSTDEGIERYGLADLIKRFIHAENMVSHVITTEGFKDTLTRALARDNRYNTQGVAEIASASFEFSFEVYARTYANRIRRLISKHEHATVEIAKLTEEEHPEAKGTEAYAPEHDFEFKGEGKVYGSFEDVYAAFADFKAEPLIEVSTMELVLEEGSKP